MKLSLVGGLVLAAGLVLTPAHAGREGLRSVERSFHAVTSPCNHPPHTRLTYHYPVKPFLRQHPIRGYFGDPRTLTTEEFAGDSSRSPGSFTFHNGVDISAPDGTRVYPVVSGVASIGYGDEVVVATGDGRVFQYFHVHPLIRGGRRVRAYRTVIGTVLPGFEHVHLSEIDDFHVQNPLDPGHLEPYRDHTVPEVVALDFSTPYGHRLAPGRLHGRVDIAANARDAPALRVPGEWFGLPVTPALVTWRLIAPDGTVVRKRIVADFLHTEPPNRRFWHVYAAGTYQNFPVFAHHYYFHQEGRYLFNLTPSPLDTTTLPNGIYVVKVAASDTCGNVGTLREQVRIANRPRA